MIHFCFIYDFVLALTLTYYFVLINKCIKNNMERKWRIMKSLWCYTSLQLERKGVFYSLDVELLFFFVFFLLESFLDCFFGKWNLLPILPPLLLFFLRLVTEDAALLCFNDSPFYSIVLSYIIKGNHKLVIQTNRLNHVQIHDAHFLVVWCLLLLSN